MLRKPTLALTTDRSKKAQLNDRCGNPEDWFKTDAFEEHGLYAASFDFFVDWDSETICNEVWIKRISDSNHIQSQGEEELLNLISDCDGRESSNRLYLFLKSQNMREKYMLFRDVPEGKWKTGEEKVVELDLSKYKKGSVSRLDAEEIQERIKGLRKKPASIGKAGLRYATSSLEGYLSKKPFFWPGDVDTVLYDGKNEVAAIIELKKHTAKSKIAFEDQRIANYLETDILKYKSLALLRDRFHTELFVLYYPIPPNIDYIIVEKLVGSPDSLEGMERRKFALPMKGNEDSMNGFAKSFIADILKR